MLFDLETRNMCSCVPHNVCNKEYRYSFMVDFKDKTGFYANPMS